MTQTADRRESSSDGKDPSAKPARLRTRVKPKAPLEVIVRWELTPADDGEIAQLCREIIETVISRPQRALRAPAILPVRAALEEPEGQTTAPISFALAPKHISGVEWLDPAAKKLRLVTDGGETIEVEIERRMRARPQVAGMPKPKQPRRPPKVHSRPGNRRKSQLDPTQGLDELIGRPVDFRFVSGGASLAVVPFDDHAAELDASGDATSAVLDDSYNAVLVARLSGEDKNETLVGQVEANLALVERYPELKPRYWVLSYDMSGRRRVRPMPEVRFPEGTPERDDMNEVDRFLAQGWLQHLVFARDDRIARAVLPAETLFDRWSENGVELWLAEQGGKVDLDDMLIHFMAVMSANERDRIVGRTRRGALRRGPLAGKGHLNHTPTFFRRDQFGNLEEDPTCWPYLLRMFELADVGLPDQAERVGLSERKIAEVLAAEGYSMDHDNIRRILKDPIYVTGEWSVNISGIPIAQQSIALKNPVPIDRFQRVQDWLGLRQGKDQRTPLGEVPTNYVPCFHKRCMGAYKIEALSDGSTTRREIQLRAYDLGTKELLLRHNPVVPDCCSDKKGRGKGGAYTLPVEEIIPRIFEELRRLAEHPELLRQAVLAEEHQVTRTSTRLSERERANLEDHLRVLRERKEAIEDQAIDRLLDEPGLDLKALISAEVAPIDRKISRIEQHLSNDAAMRLANDPLLQIPRDDRLRAFLEIMTVDTPDDPFLKALRARLFSICVGRIIIDDSGEGPVVVTIESRLVPPGLAAEHADPLIVGGELLDRYNQEKAGVKTPDARTLERVNNVKTALESVHSKAVLTMMPELVDLPSVTELAWIRRRSLENDGWHRGSRRRGEIGSPAWSLTFRISPLDLALRSPNPLASAALRHLAVEGISTSAQIYRMLREQIGRDVAIPPWGYRSLIDRGWVVTAKVGFYTVFALADDLQDARWLEIGQSGGAPSRGASVSQSTSAPRSLTALPVDEAASATGKTPAQLVRALAAGELTGRVSRDGELRLSLDAPLAADDEATA